MLHIRLGAGIRTWVLEEVAVVAAEVSQELLQRYARHGGCRAWWFIVDGDEAQGGQNAPGTSIWQLSPTFTKARSAEGGGLTRAVVWTWTYGP